MTTQMIPSFCLPHVPYFVSAELITDTFNDLFQADCVKDVHVKRKQYTRKHSDGTEQLIDYNLCFIHFKDADFNQEILEKCLLKITGEHKHFRIKPNANKPFFWKVFINNPTKSVIID